MGSERIYTAAVFKRPDPNASNWQLTDSVLSMAQKNSAEEEKIRTFSDLIESADGFAQVYPEHKYEVVSVLQRNRNVVGMTGDGVNGLEHRERERERERKGEQKKQANTN